MADPDRNSPDLVAYRVGVLEGGLSSLSTEFRTYQKEQEDQRAKIRLLVYGIIATPIVGIVIAFGFAGGFRT